MISFCRRCCCCCCCCRRDSEDEAKTSSESHTQSSYGSTDSTITAKPTFLESNKKLGISAMQFYYQTRMERELEKNGKSSDEDYPQGVYECAGLALSGEFEIKNPVFTEILEEPKRRSQTTQTEEKDSDSS